MGNNRRRINRERNTVVAMIVLYCRKSHGSLEPCGGCKSLADYAASRLDKCPFQEGKTTCARCRVHCFRPDMREKIRTVMRYAGPRMIYRHPVMAVMHMLDGRRKAPLSDFKGG